jgi:hypothetical protein
MANPTRVLLSLLTAAVIGSMALPRARAETTNETLGTLRGTVVDAVTGLPTACTVLIVDAGGHKVIERDSFRDGFRCDGRFEKSLPAGRTRVRVTRGFETRAEERVVEIPAGGVVALELALGRVVDLRARGWYAGDSHAHMLHGERTIPVDFDFVALTAQAEDLQYLSLAQAWTLEDPTPERLAAELGSRSRTDCRLTWNLEAPKNYYRGDAGRCLGHCWTVGLDGRTAQGDDVIRVLLQASAHDYESDKPSFANFESHALIHAQGGAVFYSHPARWWQGPWGGQGGYPKQENMRISNLAVELPLDTLAGPTFDGLDVITGAGEFEANAMAFELWCLLLNHGYRVAGTASSDTCFDRPGGATPGVVRTYTYVSPEFSWPGLTRAMTRGRTFATSGPLLLAGIDGQPPGSAFAADGVARTLSLEGWASGTDPEGLTRLEILRNGQVIRTERYAPPISSLRTNLVVAETQPAWFCVRLFGGDPQRQRAISGAFFFEARDQAPPAAVPARVRVALLDAVSGKKLAGSVTEVAYRGTLPQEGQEHRIRDGEGSLTVPATVRLRAESPGYRPMTLSPFLDNPRLVELVTRLTAEDLLKWESFERVRSLLGETALTFRLERAAH